MSVVYGIRIVCQFPRINFLTRRLINFCFVTFYPGRDKTKLRFIFWIWASSCRTQALGPQGCSRRRDRFVLDVKRCMPGNGPVWADPPTPGPRFALHDSTKFRKAKTCARIFARYLCGLLRSCAATSLIASCRQILSRPASRFGG